MFWGSVFGLIGFLFAVALAGVGLGIRLAEIPDLSRRIVPFSGGVLMGIAFFWIIPEIAAHVGLGVALVGACGGFALLWSIDHFLHPDGPCGLRAGPLLAAASVHAFFDGWSVAVAQSQPSSGFRTALMVGLAAHKLPEGLALGVLLLAAIGSAWRAGFSALLVQSTMWLGALMAMFAASHLSAYGTSGLLAVAAGVFVYLGYHAMEDQSRQRGWRNAFVPALTGAAGAALLRLVPGI